MITAHAPAGYLVGRALSRERAVIVAALLGGIAPDFDLIWFYFVDDRAFHHHRYWVHAPAFWAAAALFVAPVLMFAPRHAQAIAVAFLAAIFVHLCLDSVTGGIMWLWPWSDRLISLIEVPPTRSHFLLSFLTHWTMVFEAAIWVAALVVGWGQWRKKSVRENQL
ncbi:MAG: metal-dependent hydrolase [Pseudomonadota bacterium]